MVQCEPRNGAIGALDRMEIAQAPRMWSVPPGFEHRARLALVNGDHTALVVWDETAVQNAVAFK